VVASDGVAQCLVELPIARHACSLAFAAVARSVSRAGQEAKSGCRIAAKIWPPKAADAALVPAIVE
jgi:hypothetical protein